MHFPAVHAYLRTMESISSQLLDDMTAMTIGGGGGDDDDDASGDEDDDEPTPASAGAMMED